MKKLIILMILLGFVGNVEAQLIAKANFVYGTIYTDYIQSGDTVGSTFTVTLGTNSGALPSVTDANPMRIVAYDASCSQPSACANREIIDIRTTSGTCTAGNTCTFTIDSRNAETPDCSSCSFAQNAKWIMGSSIGILNGLPIASPGTSGNILKSDGTNWTSSNTLSVTSITDDVIWSGGTYGALFETSGISSSNKTFTFPNRSLTIDNITTSTTTNGTGVVTGNGSVISFTATDGSGDCTSGNVCLGDHTHSGYLTTESDPQVGAMTSGAFCKGNTTSVECTDSSTYLTSVASDSTWTVHGNYPTGCTNQFVTAIGDILTCASVGIANMSSADFGNFTCNGSTCTVDSASITPAMVLGSPTDEYCLTYEATGSTWEWQPCGSASGDVTIVGDCTDGDCFDGSSDGGTTIALYDGNSNKVTIDIADINADATLLLGKTYTDTKYCTYSATDGLNCNSDGGTGTIGGSTGSTDNAILRANGTGGATLQSSVVTIDDITGVMTIPKQSGVPGKIFFYETNSTDTNGMGWQGPASRSSDLYLQLPDADPSGGQHLSCATPSLGVSACTWASDGSVSSLTGANGETFANGSNGIWTMTGLGGTYNEDLSINLEGNNTVTFSSSTGVTTLDYSALNLTTTGIVTSAINTNTDANGMTSGEMTTAGMYGTMFWATGAGTWNLPGAATGMSICIYSTTAAAIVINPDTSDYIVLNGTALTAGDSITSASGAGDFICLLAKDATYWYTLGRSGIWTDTN